MNAFDFLILGLATWRLSSFFAKPEDGPFGIFTSLLGLAKTMSERAPFRQFKLYDGLTCWWCNSIWFGGFLVGIRYLLDLAFPEYWVLYYLLVVPLALSTLSIWIHKLDELLGSIRSYYFWNAKHHESEAKREEAQTKHLVDEAKLPSWRFD